MWSNDDAEKTELAASLLRGEQVWLEQGTMGLPFGVEEMRPETMETYLKARDAEKARRAMRRERPRNLRCER